MECLEFQKLIHFFSSTFTQALSYPFLSYPSSSCLFGHSVLYLAWPFLEWDIPNRGSSGQGPR